MGYPLVCLVAYLLYTACLHFPFLHARMVGRLYCCFQKIESVFLIWFLGIDWLDGLDWLDIKRWGGGGGVNRRMEGKGGREGMD